MAGAFLANAYTALGAFEDDDGIGGRGIRTALGFDRHTDDVTGSHFAIKHAPGRPVSGGIHKTGRPCASTVDVPEFVDLIARKRL